MLLSFFKTDPRTRSWFLALGDVAISPTSGPASGGEAVNVTGTNFQSGATLAIGGAAASIVNVTSTSISASTPSLPPGTLNDVVVTNPDASSSAIPNGFLADFLDTPPSHAFHGFVETIFRSGVTAGCGAGDYCPDDSVTRAQMAAFLLKARYGVCFTPPPATGTVFADVPASDPFAAWIEELASLGITGGCGGGNYCPSSPVTRAQMAAFLLKTEHGLGYTPPACSGIFGDVACPSLFADWIEQLYAESVTGGCSANPLLYCPDAANTRGQMAVFLVKTFGLQ
jgi:hypothetical protein